MRVILEISQQRGYLVLAFDCDGLMGFFLHTVPLCLARELLGVAFLCGESMAEADWGSLEDLPVPRQEYFSVARWIHHFTDHLQSVTLKDI